MPQNGHGTPVTVRSGHGGPSVDGSQGRTAATASIPAPATRSGFRSIPSEDVLSGGAGASAIAGVAGVGTVAVLTTGSVVAGSCSLSPGGLGRDDRLEKALGMPSVGRADDLRPDACREIGREVRAGAGAQRDAPFEKLPQGSDVLEADAAHVPLEERRTDRRGRDVRCRPRHPPAPLPHDERAGGASPPAL